MQNTLIISIKHVKAVNRLMQLQSMDNMLERDIHETDKFSTQVETMKNSSIPKQNTYSYSCCWMLDFRVRICI